MKFRLIPPGEFLMGSSAEEIEAALLDLRYIDPTDKYWLDCVRSEVDRHKVILTKPTFIGVHEVTQGAYEKMMGKNPSYFAATGAEKDAVADLDTTNHPVEMVSWNDAAEFCEKLSKKENLKPFYFRSSQTIVPLNGIGYRLPTEAEWEFACRAGTETKYCVGDKDEDLLNVGWFGTNSGGRTHAVGELRENPFGLYDIHGNVWEWVQDGYDQNFYRQFQDKTATDPNSPFLATPRRVFRGGLWFQPASVCRSSARISYEASFISHGLGYRMSLTVDAVKTAIAEDKANPAGTTKTDHWHSLPAEAPKPAIAPFDADQAKKHQEEWAAYLKVPVEYTNSIGMKFRLIPPGEFMMGSTQEEIEACLPAAGDDVQWQDCIKSEGPQHKVILTQPVYIGVNEVTQAQFQQITQKNPSSFAVSGKWAEYVAGVDTTSLPVEGVLWNDAVEFCRLLMEKEGLVGTPDGVSAKAPYGNEPYRLPSEAEWEFACRSGSHAAYDNGDSADDLQKVGWYIDNSKDRTHAVGELSSNSFGLFDMHGNAWEWVLDAWSSDWYSRMADQVTENPFNPPTGDSERMTRGGNYISGTSSCTSASRCSEASAHSVSVIGFRLALSVDVVRRAMK